MNKKDLFRIFKIDDLIQLPDAVMSLLEKETDARNEVYEELMKINHYDMSHDWFQDVYENELSERKAKKQDFTPNSVGIIASLITGNPEGWIHEPTAGNGSMIIADWWRRCRKKVPWDYYPSQNMVCCWELSNRSIPILLLNLSIRGIMGYVYHGDVLENAVKMRYVLLNRKDDALGFSEIIKDPECNLKITRHEVERIV